MQITAALVYSSAVLGFGPKSGTQNVTRWPRAAGCGVFLHSVQKIHGCKVVVKSKWYLASPSGVFVSIAA